MGGLLDCTIITCQGATPAEIFRSIGLANDKIDDLLLHLEILSNAGVVGDHGTPFKPYDRMSNEIDAELAAVDVALESARLELEHELDQLEPAETVLSPEEAQRLLSKRDRKSTRLNSSH